VFTLHGTQKLRDRAKQALVESAPESTTWLGDWYGTVLFWRPQLALLVNEQTLFPTLMGLAPAATLLERFPVALDRTMTSAGIERRFIEVELAEMGEGAWAKTASRSVLGVMNEFAFLAGDLRQRLMIDDPVELSLRLARVPCSPLYRRHITPGRELEAAVAAWMAEHGPER
jgi:hypothetical protein